MSWRANRQWFGLWLLNTLLFVPTCAFSRAAVFPKLVPKAAVDGFESSGLRAFASLFLRRDNQDVFRISFDLGLIALLLIATAQTRFRTGIRRVLVALYMWLLIFLTYHYAVSTFFERKPALAEDWRFLLNLGHFLASVMSPSWFAICAGFVLALVFATQLAALTFRELQLRAASWPRRRRAGIAFGFLVPCLALFVWLGVERDEPVVQLQSKHMLENWRTSRAEAARLAELHERNPDRRYDSFMNVKLESKPNFYFLMIEAYGEILATWDMRDAYRALLARVEDRLRASGYHAATGYSAAPVHSGTSWFSISTVHTGTRIDRPDPYDALQLVGARVPSLTRFFDKQGYKTYTLQPGSCDHAGLKRLDLFNHDVVADGVALGYRGFPYGWGGIPDQYSWGLFHERWFNQPTEPYYVYYMAVSTHWAWEGTPPYARDWRSLSRDDYVPPEYRDAQWPEFPQVQQIGTDLRRTYFQSIEYEWRVLLDVLEADHSPNIVVAIVGDHQPRLETDPPAVTMNTPVHMLSRDPAFIDSFLDAGFTRGMYAEPKATPSARHEGLFSLWASKLTDAYGVPNSPHLAISPNGARLSTLSR